MSGNLLADYRDANGFLDGSKLSFGSAQDATADLVYASRMVRAHLAAAFPENVSLWEKDTAGAPNEEAPEIIVIIASMLAAARFWKRSYSQEEIGDDDSYGARLEEHALKLLEALATGAMTLADKDYTDETLMRLTRDDFWPNDTTGVLVEDDGVKFKMGLVF